MLRLIWLLAIVLMIFVSLPQIYDSHSRPVEQQEKPTVNTYGSFHTETIRSFDNRFRLEINAETNMIELTVFEEASNTIVDSFKPVRKWDFWGVCFENDNYNIWIQSSDVGTICYEYRDGKWQYYPEAVKPSYILGK